MSDETVSFRAGSWTDGGAVPDVPAASVQQKLGTAPPGVILMGGDCGALGVARSLGRHGVALHFLPGPNPIARFSRYTRTISGWPGAESDNALPWLEAYGETGGARGSVLIPAGDSEVRLVTNNHQRLGRLFRLTTPPWEVTRFAADKFLTYDRAAELGIGHPKTYRVTSRATAEAIDATYPLILKPAMKEGVNALTIAKTWRADDRAQFLAMFDSALDLAGAGGLIVQELIPDDGTNQFSYCAFAVDGEPRVVMNASRTRQKPRKAGTATYVETLGPRDFETDARAFLKSLNYTGLIEIEFMLDPRDQRYKLIDVNPRVWTWHALGLPAGVNFALAAWSHAIGLAVPASRAETGHAWIYTPRDLPGAIAGMRDGRLPFSTYLRQLAGASAHATFALDDPLPVLLDTPLGLLRAWHR